MPDDLTQTPGPSASASSGSSVLLLIAVTASWTLSQMSYYAQTQLLGPLMTRFDLGEAQVGVMLSQELTVFALTAVFIAGPLSRISRVRVAMFGGLLLIAANLVSGYTESFELLRMARIISGFGGGMVGAAGTAAAASSLNPQRVFAIVTVSWGLMAAIQPVLVPYLTVPYGASGGFYGIAGVTVLILPLCFWLLPPRKFDAEQQQAATDVSEHSLSPFARIAERLGVRDAPNRAYALTAMFAMFVYEIGQGSVYIFIEQIGFRSGLEEYRIGEVLGATGVAGLLGGALAAWLGDRFGNVRPIVIGISLNVVAAFGLTIGDNPTSFMLLNLLWNSAYYFVVPYVLGVLSDMDDRGRWVVAMDAIWWLGDAPGPAVGGVLVEAGGYEALAALPLSTGLVCVVLIVQVLRRFNASVERSSGP